MTDLGLDEGQLKILDKVQKLMNVANRNPDEASAESYRQQALRLLEAYNLDMAMVGEHSATDGRREEMKLKGGAYKYQRDLWHYVAELNFCKYWCDQKNVTYEVNRKQWDGTRRMENWRRLQWHHFLIGRVVNVAATRIMAEYLEQAVERAVRDRLRNSEGVVPNTQLFSRWAVSFRNGAVYRLTDKLMERRNQLVEEDRKKKREAERNGQSTANALTISTYVDAETDANNDFKYGEGWSARRASRRAMQAAADREAEESYTRWAELHPEEAAKEAAKERKQQEAYDKRAANRKPRREKKSKDDSHAFWAGYEAAEGISIDQQMGGGKQELLK